MPNSRKLETAQFIFGGSSSSSSSSGGGGGGGGGRTGPALVYTAAYSIAYTAVSCIGSYLIRNVRGLLNGVIFSSLHSHRLAVAVLHTETARGAVPKGRIKTQRLVYVLAYLRGDRHPRACAPAERRLLVEKAKDGEVRWCTWPSAASVL